MSNKEKLQQAHEVESNNAELEKVAAEEHDRLNEKLEQRAETEASISKEQLENEARASAERHAEKQEKAEASPAEKRKPKPLPRSKSNLEANFKLTLNDAQKHMSAPSKAFSKVIHNKAVERTSDVVGATVARPNAVLAGSLSAFLFTLAIYLLARRNGYPLSGTETIAAFIVGWLVGNLFDYLRLMITGKKPGQLQ
ncbi:TPA: hypothetical protein DIV49_02640 [Candidatus Saccharibacteria bacterium]|nr:hypothetical protein [Candidatus Saccharibacteria bacterium]HRJ90855.1 hypothetical protein [Candidatus Saccharibacteria bacterium]